MANIYSSHCSLNTGIYGICDSKGPKLWHKTKLAIMVLATKGMRIINLKLLLATYGKHLIMGRWVTPFFYLIYRVTDAPGLCND